MTSQLINQLRAARADYDEETRWHRFLLDAIAGTGGFIGRVGPTEVSHLGWAAEAYSRTAALSALSPDRSSRVSYIDQFPREDANRFLARINVAHYVNYTGPILETLLAYISKEEMGRDGLPESVKEWMVGDVDGTGSTWNDLMIESVRPGSASVGYLPLLLDIPSSDGSELSAARARELGLNRVRATALYPMNLLDWNTDETGRISAAKIRTDVVQRQDLLGSAVIEEHYALWYPDHVEKYVVTVPTNGQPSVSERVVLQHSHGRVPLIVFRPSRMAQDPVRGASVVGDLATVNRRLFNLDSELDDHLRNSCFSILAIPVESMQTDVADVVAGNGSGMKVLGSSNRGLEFVAPPSSVPEAMEKRRDVLVRELYRCARVEYAKPSGVTTSGIARAYEFEQTNRRLGDIAAGFARAEQEALRLVAQMLGTDGSSITVTAPADFSVEDMTADLQNVIASQGMKLGATADAELKRRTVRRMLPNLPADTMAVIDEEIDELRDEQAQADAMAREVETARLEQGEQPAVDNTEPGSGEVN